MYIVYQTLFVGAFGDEGLHFTLYTWIPAGSFQVLLQPRRRQPDRGAAHRGHDRRHARARLLDRLHGPRPQPLALLRLPQPVHVQHAAARPGGQLPAAVRGVGAGRPVELPADRLLVLAPLGRAGGQEGVPGQPRRRLRLRAGHRRGLDDGRHAQLHHHRGRSGRFQLLPAALQSGRDRSRG